MKHFYLLPILLGFSMGIQAAEIHGRVTDTLSEPLPFANIYVKGTTMGTSTNADGYYHLELPEGNYLLVFQYLGYEVKIINVVLAAGQRKGLDVELEPRYLGLREAVVTDGEDPAYRVIRAAIAKRKDYLEAIPSYSNGIYSKAIIKMRDAPGADSAELDSVFNERDLLYQGILYFSETISKGICEKGKACRKIVHSSRVSGESGGLSFNFIFEDPYNFYENNVNVNQLTQRGIISPIAANALFFYKYRLEEAYYENGLLVNKIEVIPKRPNDPVFKGYIHIVEDSWRIYSTDLMATGKNGIRLLDTVQIRQTYLPVNDSLWMVFNQNFYFTFNLFGFSAAGNFLGVYSNYEINPAMELASSREVLKVEIGASDKDSMYWKEIRPVPLSNEELLDYHVKDSIEVVRGSKEYKDSVDKKLNKITLEKIIISGYTHYNSFKKQYFGFSPLLFSLNFNTVEGMNVNLIYSYWERKEERPSLNLSFFARYGFSNQHLNGGGEYASGMWQLAAGRDVEQYDENEPVFPLVNTFTSLFNKENFMKIYEKSYVRVGWHNEVLNGITPKVEVEYAQRNQLFNTTDFSLSKDKDQFYTDNIPDYPEPAKFGNSKIFMVKAGMRLVIASYYMTLGGNKVNVGSKWPDFILSYEMAIPGIFGSDANYNLAELGVNDEMDLKLLGISSYDLRLGRFLNRNNIYFQDYRHFSGNEIGISIGGLNEFMLLPYYKYSSEEDFLEMHYEHNFEGFIFNKIPLIRKLKWQLVAGGKSLLTSGQKPYYELILGIDNFLNLKGLSLLRIDFAVSFRENGRTDFGYVIRSSKSFKTGADGNSISISL